MKETDRITTYIVNLIVNHQTNDDTDTSAFWALEKLKEDIIKDSKNDFLPRGVPIEWIKKIN